MNTELGKFSVTKLARFARSPDVIQSPPTMICSFTMVARVVVKPFMCLIDSKIGTLMIMSS